MNLSSFIRLAFAAQTVSRWPSRSSRDADPHLLISIPCSWTLCVSSALTKELREAGPETGIPGHLPAPSTMRPDIKVSPESGGACEGGRTAHPHAQIWQGGEKKGKEAFEKTSPAPSVQPDPAPVAHLLAVRQLFSFYDILGFRLPAKSNLCHFNKQGGKNPPSQS